eukprot:Rhum_TRINITY_DN21059_c0_g1::Rhum_TRINITY_DN21059_c0_g1_i1::g.173062::m.173062
MEELVLGGGVALDALDQTVFVCLELLLEPFDGVHHAVNLLLVVVINVLVHFVQRHLCAVKLRAHRRSPHLPVLQPSALLPCGLAQRHERVVLVKACDVAKRAHKRLTVRAPPLDVALGVRRTLQHRFETLLREVRLRGRLRRRLRAPAGAAPVRPPVQSTGVDELRLVLQVGLRLVHRQAGVGKRGTCWDPDEVEGRGLVPDLAGRLVGNHRVDGRLVGAGRRRTNLREVCAVLGRELLHQLRPLQRVEVEVQEDLLKGQHRARLHISLSEPACRKTLDEHRPQVGVDAQLQLRVRNVRLERLHLALLVLPVLALLAVLTLPLPVLPVLHRGGRRRRRRRLLRHSGEQLLHLLVHLLQLRLHRLLRPSQHRVLVLGQPRHRRRPVVQVHGRRRHVRRRRRRGRGHTRRRRGTCERCHRSGGGCRRRRRRCAGR